MPRQWPAPDTLAEHAGKVVAFDIDGAIKLVVASWTELSAVPREKLAGLCFLVVPRPGVAIIG